MKIGAAVGLMLMLLTPGGCAATALPGPVMTEEDCVNAGDVWAPRNLGRSRGRC